VVRLAAASVYASAAWLILRGRTTVGLEKTVEAGSDVDCCLSKPLKRVEKLVERPCTLCLVVITDLRDEICFISEAKPTIHNCTRLEDLVRARKATHRTRWMEQAEKDRNSPAMQYLLHGSLVVHVGEFEG